MEREGEFNVPSLFKGRLGWVSCAKHTETDLPSNRPIVLTTLKKAAFTLAEVLITLGIIGVVAAMTLPTLIQNHKKQTYVNQLKKVVNTLGNAVQMAIADEGVSNFDATKLSRFVFNDPIMYDCVGGDANSCDELKNVYSKLVHADGWLN